MSGKARENTSGLMAVSMKDGIKITKPMEEEGSYMLMETYLKESG
jgi:hypothetical protein